MLRAKLLLLAAVTLLTAAGRLGGQTPAPGSAKVTGTVLDTTQLPLSEAVVELLGFGQTRTNGAGLFRFTGVPSGAVILHVAKIGFQPVMKVIALAVADSVDLDVTLRPAAYQLATVVIHRDSSYVMPDLTGFDRRRRSGMGHYITADEIAQRHATETSQLLSGVPGISINGGVVTTLRGVISINSSCASVVVLVDGVVMAGGNNPLNHGGTGFDINTIPPGFIKSIEVYAGPATTPVELGTPSVCGLVAIWTR
jgi:TonB-dependent Receptor Plug Domain/Carboxypeptidase regulatory-like domain